MIVPIKYQRVCRWAVKEATYKALNERVGESIRFYEMCYLREESCRFFDLLAAMHSFCIQEIEWTHRSRRPILTFDGNTKALIDSVEPLVCWALISVEAELMTCAWEKSIKGERVIVRAKALRVRAWFKGRDIQTWWEYKQEYCCVNGGCDLHVCRVLCWDAEHTSVDLSWFRLRGRLCRRHVSGIHNRQSRVETRSKMTIEKQNGLT